MQTFELLRIYSLHFSGPAVLPAKNNPLRVFFKLLTHFLVLCLSSTGWRRRRRRRRRRKRPWSRPARARWRARRRRFRGVAETMMKRTRRASSTQSSSFCQDLYRIFSRSKQQNKSRKSLDAGSSLAWARLGGKGGWGSLSRGLFGWKGFMNWCRVENKGDWVGDWSGYL